MPLVMTEEVIRDVLSGLFTAFDLLIIKTVESRRDQTFEKMY